MNNNDTEQFAKLMATLAEVFDDGREPSAFKVEVYYQALKKFSIEQISQAVQTMIIGRVYPSFPKPAEIVEAIQGRQEHKATLAWVKVLETVRRVGNYQSVKFEDPVIHSVIEVMGGWIELGNMSVNDEKWKQKEFEKLYSVMESRGNHPEYLIGITERDNMNTGCESHIPKPLLIGYLAEQEVKKIA
jgi:hypothetical protein